MKYLICDDYDHFIETVETVEDASFNNVMVLAYCLCKQWKSKVQLYELRQSKEEKKTLRYICSVDF